MKTVDLLNPATETKSGRLFRDYDEASIEQLKTIVSLRKLHFSIDEIHEMLDSPEKLAELLQKHSNELQREIGVMTQICKLLDTVDYTHTNRCQRTYRAG